MFPTRDFHQFVLIAMFLSCFHLQYGMAEQSFFGRSGDTVSLHPENLLSEDIVDIRWKYNDTPACSRRKGQTSCIEGYSIFPNGTLTLNASKSRGGTYSLDMYDTDGRSVQSPTITLRVLEPVSGAHVQSACTVDGWVTLRCSVTGGDDVTFRWTLNTTSENSTVSKERTATFYNLTPENLVCEVENAVSRQHTPTVALRCREYISVLITLGASVVIVLFCVALWSIRKTRPEEGRDVEDDVYVTMKGSCEAKREIKADVISKHEPSQLFHVSLTFHVPAQFEKLIRY
ncbi:T-cell surface antigen CD2-like isoform X2 [Brienomyrus brachyistius]|uniref:T-cell surface antigen CD2-like isoform X2 n=1 Tax=Brienomyrus brachyistius TaxID=42636 RepID=UPI0020B28016|nr:T-cell surface antigen CD2-like isoform X2 [Brienomyrus brachyistius]